MSLKTTPGCGKSGMSRTSSFRWAGAVTTRPTLLAPARLPAALLLAAARLDGCDGARQRRARRTGRPSGTVGPSGRADGLGLVTLDRALDRCRRVDDGGVAAAGALES